MHLRSYLSVNSCQGCGCLKQSVHNYPNTVLMLSVIDTIVKEWGTCHTVVPVFGDEWIFTYPLQRNILPQTLNPIFCGITFTCPVLVSSWLLLEVLGIARIIHARNFQGGKAELLSNLALESDFSLYKHHKATALQRFVTASLGSYFINCSHSCCQS